MRIILSPAKKMKMDTDSFPVGGMPEFLPQAETLLEQMQGMSYPELKALWKCNDQIAALNFERLQTMDLRRNLTPAILAYVGIQYRYMAPGVFTREEFGYVEEHVRILSGFYGVLRPFDGVTPYRLEMGAKLAVRGKKDLYAFWGDRLTGAVAKGSGGVLNLASKEYSRCVMEYLPREVPRLTCVFAEGKGEKWVEKGTQCKMARGEMVRWMAQRQVKDWEELKDFRELGYSFVPEKSDEENYVFLKEGKR